MFTDQTTLLSLPAAADIDPHILVKQAAGQYAVAGVADLSLGATQRKVKTGEATAPRRPSAGSMILTASAAIAVDSEVVQAASGKVKLRPTSGGGTAVVVGVAVTAAAADGDWITVEPRNFGAVVTIPA